MSSKLTSREFNKKYDLDVNSNSFEFISKEEMKSKEKQQLSGKVQVVWKDVLKRFFKNKFNIFFTLLLLVLILMVIIVPLTSYYGTKEPVSSASSSVVRFNKPGWAKDWNIVSKNMSVSDYLNAYNKEGYGDFDKAQVISHSFVNGFQNMPVVVHVKYINKFAESTILGTDSIGRDVWSRLFTGARWSLSLAVLVATIETIIGTTVGIYIGYHVGGRADTISMRFIEIFKSVPTLLWMFIFSLIIGTSFGAMAFVLILVGWVAPVYVARMYTLKIKDEEFIKAARSLGVSEAGILFKHVLPNIVGRLLVSFVQRIPAVIFIESTLIFLGMTVGSGDGLSIGNLIKDAKSLEAISNNITYVLSISIFLLVFTISLQIISNGIRDAFDPKTEGGR